MGITNVGSDTTSNTTNTSETSSLSDEQKMALMESYSERSAANRDEAASQAETSNEPVDKKVYKNPVSGAMDMSRRGDAEDEAKSLRKEAAALDKKAEDLMREPSKPSNGAQPGQPENGQGGFSTDGAYVYQELTTIESGRYNG